jgi:hypothetical protein
VRDAVADVEGFGKSGVVSVAGCVCCWMLLQRTSFLKDVYEKKMD